MCGVTLGVFMFLGALAVLGDGFIHGFGDRTPLALVIAVVGVIVIVGFLDRVRKTP